MKSGIMEYNKRMNLEDMLLEVSVGECSRFAHKQALCTDLEFGRKGWPDNIDFRVIGTARKIKTKTMSEVAWGERVG